MTTRFVVAGAVVCLVAAPAGAGELRGRVKAEDKPVAGATVSAVALESPLEAARREARREEAPKPLAMATTKADGTFLLAVPSAPPTPPFQLQVGGGVRPVRLDRVFEPAETDDVGDFEVGRGEALAGRVVDGSGGPVVGATVTLWGGAARGFRAAAPSEPVPATATTGADGLFRFTEAAERGNRLRIEAPGFAAAELTGLRSGALRRPVTLALGRAVTGVVTLPDRKTPAPGALVRFEAPSVTGRWAEARADGAFVLEGLPREGGTVLADAGERGRGTTPAPAGGARAVIVLAPTGAVRGRVVDADTAAPIAGIRVIARGEGGTFWDRSGRDGRYEIRGLAPRAYRLSADDPRYVPWSRQAVAVTAGQAAAQDVPLVRGAGLAGRVVDEEGRPIEGAMGILATSGEHPVRFFFRTGGGIGAFRTARDGSFNATRRLPGANQRLTVSHEDYEAHTVGGIVLTSGATKSGLIVVLPKGLGVRGIVKDENGLPLPGADVEMVRAFTFQSGRGASQFSFVGAPTSRPRKQTGPDGRFEFRGLASGDYTLVASKRGYSRDRIDPVKVVEGRAGEPLEVVLKPGATISGFVKDRGGNGVPGHQLAARPSGAAPGNMGPLGGAFTEEPTGADGSFLIEGLAMGESYELQVMSETGPGPRRAGVTAPAEGVEITVTGKGRIRGQVADADGHAVTDFGVAYTPAAAGGGMRFSVRVGPGRGRGPGQMVPVHAEDGRFELEDVPAGKWDVEVSASGYQRGRAAGIGVEEGGSAEGVEVRLTRGAAILGRVLEARSGRPVLDASVRADAATGGPRFPRMGLEPGDNEASSDADGRFEITGLGPGPYRVTASHPSWTETTTSVDLKEAPVSVEIRLGRGGTLTGTVVSGAHPVAGASVVLAAAGEGFRGPFGGEQEAISDDAGRFLFERLTPGRYAATASLRGQSSPPVDVALPTADAAQDVSLVLAEGATIRGRVSGLPEAARANVSVSARGPESYFASTRTGSDGTFELTGAPRGSIALNARTGDFMSGSRTAAGQVTVGEGQTEVAAEIFFEAGFRVDGRVTRGGRPVTDAFVNAFAPGGSGGGASDRTDENGAFTLEGLQEGTYVINASSMSGGAPIQRKVQVTGDTTVDLEAPVARIAGAVVEVESARPVAEAAVEAEDPEPGPFRGRTMALTDSAGRFVLDGLDPKPYHLVVRKAAYQTEARDVTASEDAEVQIELRRGEGIGIVARDGIFGTPLRGLMVRVTDGAGTMVFSGGVSLDSDGRGEIPSLRPGQYEMRIGAGGYAAVALHGVAVPAPTLAVSLTPGGTLEIQVGPETAAHTGVKARLLGADGQPYHPGLFPPPDPSFSLTPVPPRFENVVPGHYSLAVDGGLQPEFDITEGGVKAVALP